MSEDDFADQQKRMFEEDFRPLHSRPAPLDSDQRIVNALEYMAYQLGKIRKHLESK